MLQCASCQSILSLRRLACDACGLAFEGRFRQPRLARLQGADQQLAEQILLAGGNLKEVAAALEVSYPTLRKRVDALIAALNDLCREDDRSCRALLDEVAAGRLAPEEAARLMKELNGGL